jgi:peptide/nickel transport system substrate-binding protein
MKLDLTKRVGRLALCALSLLLAACQTLSATPTPTVPMASPSAPSRPAASATALPSATTTASPVPLEATDTVVPPTPLPSPTPPARIFTIGLAVAPGSLDPANAVDESALLITRHVYEGLTAYAPGSTRPVPALAETWESTDAITWTFHLRANVYFSDGTPFTATVAAQNIERWYTRQPPGDYVFWKSLFGGFAGETDASGQPISLLRSVNAPDAQTLVVALRQPYAALPGALAMPSFAMVAPSAFTQPPAPGAGTLSSGTGAYVVQEWSQSGMVHLARNPRYWGTPPSPDELVFKAIPDNTQRLMALNVGEIDALARLDPPHYATVRANPKLRLEFDPALNVLYLGFNQARAPWNSLDCRLAVAYALDKARYVKDFYPGDGEAASTLLPPAVWGYQAASADRALDLEAARAHWQTCVGRNFKPTRTFSLYVPSIARPYLPDDPAALGAAIQQDLASAGITVTVASPAWPTWLADVHTGRADLFLLGSVGVNGDPDSFLCDLFCGSEPAFNSGATGNPLPPDTELAALLLSARADPDLARRAALYAQAQTRLFATVAAIPLAYRQSAWAFRGQVQGNVPSPIEDVFFGLKQVP